MTVNSATLPTAPSQSNPVAAAPSSSKTLTQNDFLKLLTVQMQNQDPMKPMDDGAFMGQMAQFSTLQATSTMSTDITGMRTSTDLTAANSLVGHQVTVLNKTAGQVTGTVTGVDASSGSPKITINGQPYALTDITSVVPVPVATLPVGASPTS